MFRLDLEHYELDILLNVFLAIAVDNLADTGQSKDKSTDDDDETAGATETEVNPDRSQSEEDLLKDNDSETRCDENMALM